MNSTNKKWIRICKSVAFKFFFKVFLIQRTFTAVAFERVYSFDICHSNIMCADTHSSRICSTILFACVINHIAVDAVPSLESIAEWFETNFNKFNLRKNRIFYLENRAQLMGLPYTSNNFAFSPMLMQKFYEWILFPYVLFTGYKFWQDTCKAQKKTSAKNPLLPLTEFWFRIFDHFYCISCAVST